MFCFQQHLDIHGEYIVGINRDEWGLIVINRDFVGSINLTSQPNQSKSYKLIIGMLCRITLQWATTKPLKGQCVVFHDTGYGWPIYIYGNIVLPLQASRKYRRSWSRWCLKYLSWFMTRLFPMIDWPIPQGGCSTCQPVTATGRVLGGGHGSGGESDSRTTWHVLQAVTMDWRSPKNRCETMGWIPDYSCCSKLNCRMSPQVAKSLQKVQIQDCICCHKKMR